MLTTPLSSTIFADTTSGTLVSVMGGVIGTRMGGITGDSGAVLHDRPKPPTSRPKRTN